MESTTLRWTGNVDLNNNELEKQYSAYRKRLGFIDSIGKNRRELANQLSIVLSEVSDDLTIDNTLRRGYATDVNTDKYTEIGESLTAMCRYGHSAVVQELDSS